MVTVLFIYLSYKNQSVNAV